MVEKVQVLLVPLVQVVKVGLPEPLQRVALAPVVPTVQVTAVWTVVLVLAAL